MQLAPVAASLAAVQHERVAGDLRTGGKGKQKKDMEPEVRERAKTLRPTAASPRPPSHEERVVAGEEGEGAGDIPGRAQAARGDEAVLVELHCSRGVGPPHVAIWPLRLPPPQHRTS